MPGLSHRLIALLQFGWRLVQQWFGCRCEKRLMAAFDEREGAALMADPLPKLVGAG